MQDNHYRTTSNEVSYGAISHTINIYKITSNQEN